MKHHRCAIDRKYYWCLTGNETKDGINCKSLGAKRVGISAKMHQLSFNLSFSVTDSDFHGNRSMLLMFFWLSFMINKMEMPLPPSWVYKHTDSGFASWDLCIQFQSVIDTDRCSSLLGSRPDQLLNPFHSSKFWLPNKHNHAYRQICHKGNTPVITKAEVYRAKQNGWWSGRVGAFSPVVSPDEYGTCPCPTWE